MATVAKVLDRTRFEARARIIDILALGLVVVIGAALVFDMYTFGYQAAQAVASGGAGIVARDQVFVRMLAESFISAAALCWIGYRLLSGSARRAGA